MKYAMLALIFLPCLINSGAVSGADTLARIRQTQEIRLGYSVSAAPFSSAASGQPPQGYSVDLCARVAADIGRQLGTNVKPVWVALDVAQRLDAVRDGRVDIECGTTTWTLTRQQTVDFSLVTFVDGASLLATQASGIRRIADAGGKNIVVIRNTTTEKALTDALSRAKVTANVTRVSTREQALAMIIDGRVDAFASDRFLLSGALSRAKPERPLRLIDEDYSVEPYALVLPRNDPDFRLAVNRSLAGLFRSGEIANIYERWFAQFGQPSLLLSALYYLQAVPE